MKWPQQNLYTHTKNYNEYLLYILPNVTKRTQNNKHKFITKLSIISFCAFRGIQSFEVTEYKSSKIYDQ